MGSIAVELGCSLTCTTEPAAPVRTTWGYPLGHRMVSSSAPLDDKSSISQCSSSAAGGSDAVASYGGR